MGLRQRLSGLAGGRGKSRPSKGASSVLGSTLGDVAGRLQGRGLPKGGIREGNLKVDPSATGRLTAGDQRRRGRLLRGVIISLVVVVTLVVVTTVGVTLLSHTSTFTIESIDATATEHVSAETIARLAKVESGATLLNVDVQAVEENLRRNPWIESATITREFPDRLGIEVHERPVGEVVVMSTGDIAWLLGADGVWIEPVHLTVPDGQNANDVALSLAEQYGALLVTDAPSSMEPTAGATATDDCLRTVELFQEQFSQDFRNQIASYSVEDSESVTCVLESGVEVSLGSASNVDTKEALVRQLLEKYPGELTYVNVRVPSKPAYRRLDSSSAGEGTGATGTSVEDGSSYSDSILSDKIGDPADVNDDSTAASASGSSSGSGSSDSGSSSQ